MNVQGEGTFTIKNNILEGLEVPLPEGYPSIGKKLLDALKKNPEFVGQIDARTGESLTHGKLADASVRCALWMQNEKVAPGDIISIYSPSNIALFVPLLAVFYIGATVSVWPPEMPSDTTRHYVNLVKPKILFTTEEEAKNIKSILQEEKIEAKIIVFGNVSGFVSCIDIEKEQDLKKVAQFQCSNVKPDNNAVLLLSSGSTGNSKCIQHTYEGVRHIVFSSITEFWKEKSGIVTFWNSKMCGNIGLFFTFSSIITVSPNIVMNQATVEEICATIEKYKIQFIFAHTHILHKLANSESLRKYNLSSLKDFILAGSKVKGEDVNTVKQIISSCHIIPFYGTTELGGLTAKNLSNNNFESCGTVCFNVQLKVIDLNIGKKLGPNQTGEICCKRPFMMKGYYNNAKATEEVIDSEGWLHTGDLGYYDKEGNVYIGDRIKAMIKYKNDLISPTEIEDVLLQHPGVIEAVVLPMSHPMDGEHPIAFVTKSKNSKVSEEELIQLSSSLGENKILRGGVLFIEKMPYMVTEKVNRLMLMKMAKCLEK